MLRGILQLVGFESSSNGMEGCVTEVTSTPKIAPIPSDLQCSFAQNGVQHNIKIVLRGERRVGKTALLHRLQGKLIPATYAPSGAISATTVRWQASDDTELTKVEVWDVVDKGFPSNALCSSSEKELRVAAQLLPMLPTDASTVDVYRNCSCVMFLLDVTRLDTFDYVSNEVRKVPPHIPICILANFFDQPRENHSVSREMLEKLRESISPALSPLIRGIVGNQRRVDSVPCAPATIVELSLATGYGMSVLHNYLSIPFSFSKAIQAEELLRTAFDAVRQAYNTVNGLCVDQNFEKYMSRLRENEAERARGASAENRPSVLDCKSNIVMTQEIDVDFLESDRKALGSVSCGNPAQPTVKPAVVAPVSQVSSTIEDVSTEALNRFFGCEPDLAESSEQSVSVNVAVSSRKVLRPLSQPRKT